MPPLQQASAGSSNPAKLPDAEGTAIAAILEIIAPIFGIVLIGWLAARARTFDEAATRGLSLFAFNVAIPVMLVRTLARADLPAEPEWSLLLAYFAAALAVFALAAAAAAKLFGQRGAAPAIYGISAAFSNTIILGIPLILEAFGEAAAVPLSLIVACHSALLFTVTTICAEAGLGAAVAWPTVAVNIGRGLAANPILWGIAAGLALNLLELRLPTIADRLAETLGAAALPAALFALGANLARFRVAGSLRAALLLTGLKILVHPMLVWALGTFVFPLRPLTMTVALTLAALPTGINAYLFAARYETSAPEATSTILVSTLIAVATLGGLLAALR